MARPKTKPQPITEPAVKETRESKLVRLSARRVEKACKAISLVGNLASYKPTDVDVDFIMMAIGQTCAGVEGRLRGAKKDSYAFNLRNIPAPHG